MAKKKKFGILDAIDVAEQAANAFAAYKSAKADSGTADKKTTKAFKDGDKTNLQGAEGGASKPKLGMNDSGMSSLARESNRKNFMQ